MAFPSLQEDMKILPTRLQLDYSWLSEYQELRFSIKGSFREAELQCGQLIKCRFGILSVGVHDVQA